MSLFPAGLLKPIQERHAEFLLDSLRRNRYANDTSDTGVGKTYCAVALARAMNLPVFVVAPKSIRNKWVKLLKEWQVKVIAVTNYEKLVRGNTEWLSYNKPPKDERGKPIEDYPRNLLTKLHLPKNALVILDEAHRCKAYNSLSSGIMIATKKQGFYFLNLSATLAVDPREMKAIGYATNLIRTPEQRDYKAFCIDHGAEWVGKWGALTFNADDPEAKRKMLQIHNNWYHVQRSTSRLTRADMAEYFTENHVNAEAYTMDEVSTRKIQRVYDWLDSELEKLYEHCEGYSANPLTLILKARQEIELLKVPLFCELILDSFEEGNSVVCFVNFTRTWQTIAKKLQNTKKTRNHLAFIHGNQKDRDRIQNISDFQADNRRIMLANQRAGGIAIDLQDIHGNYPRSSILSPTFDAREILQAIGRISRVDGLTPCYQTFAFVAGTIEERATARVQAKADNLSLLNDGDLSCGIQLYRR